MGVTRTASGVSTAPVTVDQTHFWGRSGRSPGRARHAPLAASIPVYLPLRSYKNDLMDIPVVRAFCQHCGVGLNLSEGSHWGWQ